MTYLMALSWLVYGGDVERMGDRDYSTRAAAYSRLKAAGPWAVPALWAGRRNGNPERQLRIELILSRRASVWGRVIWSVLSDRRVSDGTLHAVGRVMAKNPDLAAMVYDAVDLSGGFSCESSERWVFIQPFLTGDLASENAHMLKQTRVRLLFPPPPPDPTTTYPDDFPPP